MFSVFTGKRGEYSALTSVGTGCVRAASPRQLVCFLFALSLVATVLLNDNPDLGEDHGSGCFSVLYWVLAGVSFILTVAPSTTARYSIQRLIYYCDC